MRLRPPLSLVALLLAPPLYAQSVGGDQTDYAGAMYRAHAAETPTANASARAPRQDVVGEEVEYGTLDGVPLKGYFAHPANASRGLPGIVVVHEWWGLNDNIRMMTRRLAGEGYLALAVDLYGGRTATTADEAVGLYREAMADIPRGERNLAAAIAYLRGMDAPRIGTVGWCFGGHWSLRAALVGGSEVQAAVMYYGRPILDPADLGRMRAPLLGLFGGADRGIPVDSVQKMAGLLRDQGLEATIHVYDGAGHAFANPSGQSYNAAAAEDAWQRTLAFYQKYLKTP